MDKLQAFNNDPQLKEGLLVEARKHEAADEIIQGTYGNSQGWCAVGCTIKSYNDKCGKDFSTSDHSVYEKELGIPRIIARLEDRLFEGMDFKDAKGFPVKFLDAITPGVDLSLVPAKFFVWLLVDPQDGVIKFARSDRSKKAIQRVADLYQDKIDGKEITQKQWDAAYAAAAAAYADAAADAAAAAAAAYADAAAYAADAAAAAYADAAAYAAAYAAAAAASAYARKTHFKKMADKLLELLRLSK